MYLKDVALILGMLPETEKILSKFREINLKPFYEIARDFIPDDQSGRRDGSFYGNFDEEGEIYSLMYTLHLQLDEQIFRGNYDIAYASPIEPIKCLKELFNYFKGHIESLTVLNRKYNCKVLPIKVTLDCYQKTQDIIKYVLGFAEIKRLTGDDEKDKLNDEVIELKTKEVFRRKSLRISILFIFYLFCLIIPTIVIIILWSSHKDGKWFQLILVLFPIISFLYDKVSFLEVFRFIFWGKYRKNLKEKIRLDISKTTLNQST